MDSFDPYQNWLGVPSQLRPLNHYILLGIQLFESDSTTIQNACETRLSLLREFQSGPRGALSEQIMTQVIKARNELLDATRKSNYDQQLRIQWEQLEADREQESESVTAGSNLDAVASDAAASQKATSQNRESSETVATTRSMAGLQSPASLPADLGDEDSEIARPDAENAADGESLISLLLDIRILVALLSIVVLVMTATVLLFSDKEGAKAVETKTTVEEVDTQPPIPVDTAVESGKTTTGASGSIRKIAQSSNGSFDLPPKLAQLSGPELESSATSIAQWQTGGWAEWGLAVADRRTGYFYCEVTYQAKAESQFSVQLGEGSPRIFTVYPHREDFTETFFVRFDKLDEQSLKLLAKQVESIAEVRIKNIKLRPR